jgi:hypothetical protein
MKRTAFLAALATAPVALPLLAKSATADVEILCVEEPAAAHGYRSQLTRHAEEAVDRFWRSEWERWISNRAEQAAELSALVGSEVAFDEHGVTLMRRGCSGELESATRREWFKP